MPKLGSEEDEGEKDKHRMRTESALLVQWHCAERTISDCSTEQQIALPFLFTNCYHREGEDVCLIFYILHGYVDAHRLCCVMIQSKEFDKKMACFPKGYAYK